jgi:hypothetical protein
MAWVLLFLPVHAFICSKECIDDCVKRPNSTCVQDCCPGYGLRFDDMCALSCEDRENSYSCSDKCSQEQSTCHENCQSFCDHRKDSCFQSCLNEFCGPNSSQTNWIFVIGLIMLFCGFVIVLYTQIDNIVTKSSEFELLYT